MAAKTSKVKTPLGILHSHQAQPRDRQAVAVLPGLGLLHPVGVAAQPGITGSGYVPMQGQLHQLVHPAAVGHGLPESAGINRLLGTPAVKFLYQTPLGWDALGVRHGQHGDRLVIDHRLLPPVPAALAGCG